VTLVSDGVKSVAEAPALGGGGTNCRLDDLFRSLGGSTLLSG